MPKIIAPNTSAAIQTAAGAHNYRLIGRAPDSTARLIVHVLLTATRIDAAVSTKPTGILRLAEDRRAAA
jgi:hypothetical protein